jgi:DNA-binding PadR family transcriptional regulator
MKRSVQAGWVLREFLGHPGEPQHGYGLMETTRLPSGSVYPLLARFFREGWLTRTIEDTPRSPGRLRRTLYTLTPEGEQAAREYVAALDSHNDAIRKGRTG